MTEPQITLEVIEVDGQPVVVAAGEIDIATSPALRDAIDGVIVAGHHRVVVDIDGVGFMDSAGLNVFVNALKQMGPTGSLCVVTTQPHIRKIFTISGIEQVIAVFDSVAAANASNPVPGKPED